MYLFYCLVLLVYFVKVVFWFLWIYFFFTLKREKKAGPSLFNTFESVRVYIRACSNISTKFKCLSFTVGSIRSKGAIFDSFFWIFNTLICREKFPFQCSLVAPQHGRASAVQGPFKREHCVLAPDKVTEMESKWGNQRF